jgi:hypothetical protein
VFGFDGNEIGIQVAVGYKFGKVLDNVRLRSDRVSRNNVDITQSYRFGNSD